ncbi:MAG: SPFH domain-containing protein, partial [Bacillota bacterium]
METVTKTTFPAPVEQSQGTSIWAYLVFGLVFALGWAGLVWGLWKLNLPILIGSFVVTALCLPAFKVAAQWQKAVVLRLGRLHKVAGPGPFLIIPIVDSVVAWVDQRIIATSFHAEETLTKDTVPVDV